MSEFDLRDVLANRKYPTTHLKVWTDEEGFFELAALERQAADTADDEKKLADLERKIAAKKRELRDTAVTVHLRGTSRRAREDMQTEALTQYPIKRDVYGRDDDLQKFQRGNLLTELYFAAHMTKIVAPGGGEQILDDDNRRDVARAFLDEAPEYSVKLVDIAIGALRGEAEMQQGVDFLSAT